MSQNSVLPATFASVPELAADEFRQPRGNLRSWVERRGRRGIQNVIRPCGPDDFEGICEIINDGAQAYRGVIPADCWTEPYMSRDELRREMEDGVTFWGYDTHEGLAGVMGIQPVEDVTLIRHAYVRTANQKQGIGGRLLAHLRQLARGPVLIGTWADAVWAIRFYEKQGFHVVRRDQKEQLLRRYWKIPDRQAETSVVLADEAWREE